MTQRVWKFDVPISDELTVEMPANAQILAVQVQTGRPAMWALCSPDAPRETRRFRWFGTGHPMPPVGLTWGHIYRGTVQIAEGALVFHLFEMIGAPEGVIPL